MPVYVFWKTDDEIEVLTDPSDKCGPEVKILPVPGVHVTVHPLRGWSKEELLTEGDE